MIQKKLLVLTGPQGSGNHMWSKIFALYPKAFGWGALLDEYWIGHDQEPFAEYWTDPTKLKDFDWSGYDYFVTSISVPYMLNGEPTIPKFKEFIHAIEELDIKIEFAILGRDQTIVKMQETRVRGEPTADLAVNEFYKLSGRMPHFLSYELLHLYGRLYLQQLNTILKFPVAHVDPRIEEILKEDANTKYFQPVEHHWVDDLARHTSRKWR
jgi:hypothetical protein